MGRVGRERDGSLRSGIDIDTEGREDTEEDMRLKKEGLAGGAAGSDMSRASVSRASGEAVDAKCGAEVLNSCFSNQNGVLESEALSCK